MASFETTDYFQYQIKILTFVYCLKLLKPRHVRSKINNNCSNRNLLGVNYKRSKMPIILQNVLIEWSASLSALNVKKEENQSFIELLFFRSFKNRLLLCLRSENRVKMNGRKKKPLLLLKEVLRSIEIFSWQQGSEQETAIGWDTTLDHINRCMKVAGGLYIGITLNLRHSARAKFFLRKSKWLGCLQWWSFS